MSSSVDSIQVFARFRPINNNESKTSKECIEYNPPNSVVIDTRPYNFDAVFEPISTQEEIFETVAKKHIDDAINGINTCIMAYGETAAGKTYTICGDSAFETYGIAPRIFQALIDSSRSVSVKIAMVEVYNEKVYDLLSGRTKEYGKLDIPASGEVQNLTYQSPHDSIDFYYLYNQACEYRTTASTFLNDTSSRSHLIIIFDITHTDDGGVTTKSRFFLVDLAGCENIEKSGASLTPKLRREATNINLSLLTLERLIIRLSKGDNIGSATRDSVLTMLLKSTFSGECKTSIICCCSPAESNLMNTKKTLRFGITAKQIKVKAKSNVVESVDALKIRIAYLEGENSILRQHMEAMVSNMPSQDNSPVEENNINNNGSMPPPSFPPSILVPTSSSQTSSAVSSPFRLPRNIFNLDMQLTELRGEYEAKLKYIEQLEEQNKTAENTIIDRDQAIEDLKVQMEEQKKEMDKLIDDINIRINENEKYLDSVEEDDFDIKRKSRNNSNDFSSNIVVGSSERKSNGSLGLSFNPMDLFNNKSPSDLVLERLSKIFDREKHMYNDLNIELQSKIRDISTLKRQKSTFQKSSARTQEEFDVLSQKYDNDILELKKQYEETIHTLDSNLAKERDEYYNKIMSLKKELREAKNYLYDDDDELEAINESEIDEFIKSELEYLIHKMLIKMNINEVNNNNILEVSILNKLKHKMEDCNDLIIDCINDMKKKSIFYERFKRDIKK